MRSCGLESSLRVIDNWVAAERELKIKIGMPYSEGLSMNPLDSIGGTVVSGIILAIILAFVAKTIAGV